MVKPHSPKRGEVHLVGVDPTRGAEIKKTRPCVVVSPDELNDHLSTVIVAPLTSAGKSYPFRIRCRFEGRDSLVVIDQLRTIDHARLLRRLGRLTPATFRSVLATLREMFEE